jgi:hypothetical protein
MAHTECRQEIESLRKELLKKDTVIASQDARLKRVYGMRSWRLFLALLCIKRRIALCFQGASRFLGLSFLCIVTFLIAGYLYALKKIRNTIIFPGG